MRVTACIHPPAYTRAHHRKKKAVHKTTTTDDKRLQNTLKRLGVNTIPGIEEVNIFQEDTVIHFSNPKGALRGLGRIVVHAPPQCKHRLLPTPTWSAGPRKPRVRLC